MKVLVSYVVVNVQLNLPIKVCDAHIYAIYIMYEDCQTDIADVFTLFRTCI